MIIIVMEFDMIDGNAIHNCVGYVEIFKIGDMGQIIWMGQYHSTTHVQPHMTGVSSIIE